jgi:hypothetical protein
MLCHKKRLADNITGSVATLTLLPNFPNSQIKASILVTLRVRDGLQTAQQLNAVLPAGKLRMHGSPTLLLSTRVILLHLTIIYFILFS